MREYKLIVPADCTISNTQREKRQALRLMKDYLKADIGVSTRIKFRRRGKGKRSRSR